MVKLTGIFSQFRPIKVILFGDYMLDKYTQGSITRVSPEAPVSILKVESKRSLPGGAGNVILNLLSLKAEVTAVGRIGNDQEGKDLFCHLKDAGACIENLIQEKHYPTPVKNRLIAGSQQVIRVDSEKICPLSKELEETLIKKLPKLIQGQEIVAISDYGKGFLSNRLIQQIIQISKDLQIPVIVDPKGRDFSKYQGATIIKPNLQEAYVAANLSMKEPLEKVAFVLLEKTKTKKLLITRSEEGMTLFDDQMRRKDFPVIAKEVKDVTGAGDSVLAMIAVCVAHGFDMDHAIPLSNIAAGIAIEQVGCAKVHLSDVAHRLLEVDVENKIFEDSHLFALKEVLKDQTFVILEVNSKKGITTPLFRSIAKLSEKPCKLIIYVGDKDPEYEFITLLSSLTAVDFIILKKESLKSLCEKIHPEEVFEIQKGKLISISSKKFFQR